MSQRAIRVAEQLRAELAQIILRGRLRDPRAKDAIVSAVKVSADLSVAHVYMRKLGQCTEKQQESLIDAMTKAAGFLRREISPTLRLRRTPELRFVWDDLVDSSTRMEEILHELSEERDNRSLVSDTEYMQPALNLIAAGENFLVTCHRRPDADALGSALGFAEVLRAVGKGATVFVPDELSLGLRFLGEQRVVRALDPDARFDGTFVMDTAAVGLLPVGLPDASIRGPLIIVDHHAVHDDVGDIVVRNTEACATGEVIMDLAEALGARPVPPAAATPLYAAIVADTGGFRYPPTSPRTLRLGAELLEGGADPWQVAYELFEGWTEPRLKLLSAILDTLELDCDGRLAMLRVTRQMLIDNGADDDMVEGMVNYGRMLRGVEIAALLWEYPAEAGEGLDLKVSLRSSGRADISKIALALGGGGHKAAAGAQVHMPIQELDSTIREHAKKALAALP